MQQVEIRVKGLLDRDWSDWLGDLSINHTVDGSTILSGAVRDQAALQGLLFQLFRTGVQLISVSSEGMPPVEQGR
jgi:hypothetical protein